MFLSRIKGGLLKYHRGAFFFFPECSGSTGNKLGWDNYGLFRRHTCQSGGEKRWMCSRGLTCTAVDFGRLPDWLHTSHSAFQLLERDPSDILHSQEPAAMMEIQGCISREITAANSPCLLFSWRLCWGKCTPSEVRGQALLLLLYFQVFRVRLWGHLKTEWCSPIEQHHLLQACLGQAHQFRSPTNPSSKFDPTLPAVWLQTGIFFLL